MEEPHRTPSGDRSKQVSRGAAAARGKPVGAQRAVPGKTDGWRRRAPGAPGSERNSLGPPHPKHPSTQPTVRQPAGQGGRLTGAELWTGPTPALQHALAEGLGSREAVCTPDARAPQVWVWH